MRSNYTLAPDVTYLNHGSFGAVPKVVQQDFRQWQAAMEENPVFFMWQVAPEALGKSLHALAQFVGAEPHQLGFVSNATQGINAFARSLPLAPGEEVLATNQEYGATQKALIYYCRQKGAQYVVQEVPLPAQDPDEWVEALWQGVTPRTKAVFFSHVTAPTALTFPIAKICARARAEGILTVCDGAHAPGHIDLDLQDCQVDFYTGNCHKWLSTPRGCGFIYVAPPCHALVEPLIVSHGWNPEERSKTPMHDYFSWQGTLDPCAFLTLPTAIDYLQSIDWPKVRDELHALAAPFRLQLADQFDTEPLCSEDANWWTLMFSTRLPAGTAAKLGRTLWEKYKIVVILNGGSDFDMLRVSVKEYNSAADLQRLYEALTTALAA